MKLGFTSDMPFEKIFNYIIELNRGIRLHYGKNISFPEKTEVISLKDKKKKELNDVYSSKEEVYLTLKKYLSEKNYNLITKNIEKKYPKEVWDNKLPSSGICKILINEYADLFYES